MGRGCDGTGWGRQKETQDMKWQGAMMESHMDRKEMNPKDRWLPQTARDSVNRAQLESS